MGRSITVIECAGKGRERARAHGEQARDSVHAALDRWREGTSTRVADTSRRRDCSLRSRPPRPTRPRR